MESWDGIRLTVTVLEHAIVNSMTIAALLRSICAVIPPIAYQRLSVQFDAIRMHASLQKLCISMAIILRYLTVVKAAYSVSFTLPLLYLAVKHSKQSMQGNSSGKSMFFTRTVALLCIGPFVWALPAIIIPIPTIVHDRHALHPMFFEAICTVSHTSYQIVSLTQMILPLLCATGISLAFVWYLWKSVKLPLASHTLGLLDLTRILRFGALLGIIVLSAVLYTIVMATWARDHVRLHGNMPMRTVFIISMVWEAITPILMFFIFGAQEEVFAVWHSWFRSLSKRTPRLFEDHTPSVRSEEDNSYLDFQDRQQGWLLGLRQQFKFTPNNEASTNIRFSPTFSSDSDEKVHAPPISSSPVHIHPASLSLRPVSSHMKGLSVPSPATSLRPPPRPARSRSDSPNDSPSADFLESHPFRNVPNMPSLTAFGNGDDSSEIVRGREAVIRMFEDEMEKENDYNWTAQGAARRPDTGESSQTFGN
ncbi:unnamed protein product [Somion occarium]|uniref:Pheromone receptor n=1 Tax=Somion occarium TaxID=3059160 RepID=A0ABP1CM77_9APHY